MQYFSLYIGKISITIYNAEIGDRKQKKADQERNQKRSNANCITSFLIVQYLKYPFDFTDKADNIRLPY